MPRRGALARSLPPAAFVLVLVVAFAYAGLCVEFAIHERGFVFTRMQRRSVSPQTAGLSGVSEVTVATDDGERLYGWWVPPKRRQGAIVLLTGKGIVLSDTAGLFGDLLRQGFGVIGIDWRGNGASTGTPSEPGLRADARAAFDFAHREAPQARVAAFGQSLGTWPALALGLDRPVAGVVLDSPYASVVRLFQLRGWPLPYRLLMSDPLDSEAMVGQVHAPLLILHGTADRAIPLAEAGRLYAAAHEPKAMIEVPGAGHVDVWRGAARDEALARLARWTAP